MAPIQEVQIHPLIKAFAQEIEARVPQDLLRKLGKMEGSPAIAAREGSALEAALSFIHDIKNDIPEANAATLGKDYGFIYSKLLNKHLPKNATDADIAGKAAGIAEELESACAKRTLLTVKISNDAARSFLEEKTGLNTHELKSFIAETKSFFRPIKQFFKDPLQEMRWGRVSAASIAGIGIAGGTLYLLTRQKETPEEHENWQTRVVAHAEQQAVSAQR